MKFTLVATGNFMSGVAFYCDSPSDLGMGWWSEAGLRRIAGRIVARHLPAGYRVLELARHEASGTGVTHRTERKTVECPPIRDRYALAVLAHEIGHLVLGHCWRAEPGWLQEYEADMWAIEALRAEGVSVCETFRGQSRVSVREHVDAALAKDPDADIDAKVLRWAFPDSWREYV